MSGMFAEAKFFNQDISK
ncbi:hypothetical protein JIY74_27550 [Vibrio harveyi]|nr:hypothetical protein [Vibrio harveyi]